MFTVILEQTPIGIASGNLGFITYNSMGEQINKVNFEGG